MINSIGINSFNKLNYASSGSEAKPAFAFDSRTANLKKVGKENVYALNNIFTMLQNENDTKMYNEILNAFVTSDTEKVSPQDNVLRQTKLNALLKSGILFDKNSNDGSSVMENIYKTIKTPRGANFDGTEIAGQIIDLIYSPTLINQRFGDIPQEAKPLLKDNDKHLVENAPFELEGSNTCVTASIEFRMARKMPAEFARWAESLTSPKLSVDKEIKLSTLCDNPLETFYMFDDFRLKPLSFDFKSAKFNIQPDENALTRAKIQDKFWDNGERTIVDVLIQSTLMNLAAGRSYDALTDTRLDNYSQGLIETEKTFIESFVENKRRIPVVYQNIDQDQNLAGWYCSFEEIQNNITDAIDNNQDVIIGYLLTARDCFEIADNPNKITSGHEITIVDYKKEQDGSITFVCNDTDDDIAGYVEYPASYLVPKIHHASYLNAA